MAGDWMKFEKATPDKPEVFAMAAILDIDPDAVVGKLIRVWSWFDTHTVDGNAASVTLALPNRISGVTGFAEAMQKVGWLIDSDDGVTLPNFDRHTGATAKQRAQTAVRVAKSKKGNAAGNGGGNGPSVTSALPREEKRRVDIEDPLKPPTAPASPPRSGKHLPASAEAKRIAKLFNRKESTEWSEKEAKTFRRLLPIDPVELDLIDAYYSTERAKGNDGRHRRDLATFLNNFRGEVDRAREASQPKLSFTKQVAPLSGRPLKEV